MLMEFRWILNDTFFPRLLILFLREEEKKARRFSHFFKHFIRLENFEAICIPLSWKI